MDGLQRRAFVNILSVAPAAMKGRRGAISYKCFKIFEKSVTTTLRYHAESKHNLVVEKTTVGGKKEPDKKSTD